MKTILYIGEIKDFSDRWLISQLKKFYKVVLWDIAEPFVFHKKRGINLILNRIYASVTERYGTSKIFKILDLITKMESLGIPVINSPEGYRMEINRLRQFEYFSSQNISYVRTEKFKNKFPELKSNTFYVVKNALAFRHKKLPLVKNRKEIMNLKSFNLNSIILQPLIKGRVCYRTEIIGRWYATFTQLLKIRGAFLYFSYGKLIPSPLSKTFLEKIIEVVNNLKTKVFSIEYFIIDKNPIIVDFNCTSNYPQFFIKKVGNKLTEAWTKLIQNEIR